MIILFSKIVSTSSISSLLHCHCEIPWEFLLCEVVANITSLEHLLPFMIATFFIHVDISPSPNFSDFIASLNSQHCHENYFFYYSAWSQLHFQCYCFPFLFSALLSLVSGLFLGFDFLQTSLLVNSVKIQRNSTTPYALLCCWNDEQWPVADCEEGDGNVHSSGYTSAVCVVTCGLRA